MMPRRRRRVASPQLPLPLLLSLQLSLLALDARAQTAAPAGGYPVVIFQHGITRASTDLLGVAGGLTAQGFAVVAIDAVGHGTRAVRISNAAPNCSDVSHW